MTLKVTKDEGGYQLELIRDNDNEVDVQFATPEDIISEVVVHSILITTD